MITKNLSPSQSRLKCYSCNAGWTHDKRVAKWKVLRHEPSCDVARHNGAIASAALRT